MYIIVYLLYISVYSIIKVYYKNEKNKTQDYPGCPSTFSGGQQIEIIANVHHRHVRILDERL